MCLAVPGKIIEIDDATLIAEVDYGSLRYPVSIRLVPDAREGDWVLVHAGFAIRVIDEVKAKETLSFFQEILDHEEYK